MAVSLSALRARAVVLDVEGTTTPIEFVRQVLFPFARAHAASYLEREGSSPACRAALDQLRQERALESDAQVADVAPLTRTDAILPYVHWLMDRDRKSPGLKALQGLIWQEGFRRGELRGEVYPDVPRAFERWQAGGRSIYIYSSGSVLAQQLLFGSTRVGDLTTFLSGYFDTAVGPKLSPASYRTIAQRIAVAPGEMLFVSDVVAELDAARAAHLQTVLCTRGERNEPEPSGPPSHAVVGSFDQIVD